MMCKSSPFKDFDFDWPWQYPQRACLSMEKPNHNQLTYLWFSIFRNISKTDSEVNAGTVECIPNFIQLLYYPVLIKRFGFKFHSRLFPVPQCKGYLFSNFYLVHSSVPQIFYGNCSNILLWENKGKEDFDLILWKFWEKEVNSFMTEAVIT